jgi:hypothetical protein
VRAAKEGIDGACTCADIKANYLTGGVVIIGERGGRGAGVKEVLDPEEVVETVWDLEEFVSLADLVKKGWRQTAGHSLSGGRFSFRPKSRFRRDLVSC